MLQLPATFKIVNDPELIKRQAKYWRSMGHNIVFTNGCFDLLHLGHLKYLNEAKALGNILIIGINSDSSVNAIKGAHRPIKRQEDRAQILASFSFVDLVCIFEEETPIELIKNIVPNILVKGGDWELDQIVGADIVKQNGGEVKKLSFLEGYSTSNLVAKIKLDRD